MLGAGKYNDFEKYHNKFMKRTLRVKGSTNTCTCLLYMETGRFPLSVFVNMCIAKCCLKISKSCDTNIKPTPSTGFRNIWRDQSVVTGKLFIVNFEQRLKDTHIQKCIGDMNNCNVTNAECTRKLKLRIRIAILDMI